MTSVVPNRLSDVIGGDYGSPPLNPLLNILGALAGPEFDDPEIGETMDEERIFLDNRFDLLPTIADGQDNSSISRDFSTGDQEIAGGVILFQESDMRGHVCVDVGEVGLVCELYDEHDSSACTKLIAA